VSRSISLRAWYAVALVFLLMVPGRWLLGASLPALPAAQQPQVWVWGLAFLALLLSLYAVSHAEPTPIRVASHGIVVFALAAGVMLLLGLQTSLKAWAIVVPVALLLAMLPQWLGKWLLPATVVLALATAGSALAGRPPQNVARGRPMLVTALHNVDVREYAGLIPHIERGTTGGGRPGETAFCWFPVMAAFSGWTGTDPMVT
jgi:hypothetical protein